ncbi:MAG: carboxylesterase [Legionellaceae bacterium]|nr:carboxylesterase [Legionellaceae bacterium]
MAIYFKKPQNKATACVIWMHGLGADAKDMMGVADAFPEGTTITHVFIDAPVRPVTINNHMPMRAWYNILGMTLTDREDKAGILESEIIINEVIDSQIKNGFTAQQIFLAGFSQGGAMALFVGLRSLKKIGGIISLSAYIPLPSECEPAKNTAMPMFLAMGQHDPIVLPDWTKKSYDWLVEQSYKNMELRKYPIEHSICLEEINDLATWLQKQVALIECNGEN